MAIWLKLAVQAASAAALVGGGSAAILASSSRPAYDRMLEGSVFYRIPDGFGGVQQDGGVLLYPQAAPAGDAVIVLAREVPVEGSMQGAEAQAQRANLAASIVAAVAAALIDDPKPVVREEPSPPPPRSAPLEVRSFSVASRRGRSLIARMRARMLFDGGAFHLILATRPAGKDVPAVTAGYESLYASLGFARLGDRAPRRLASPLPSALPQPGSALSDSGPGSAGGGRRQGPQCRIVQRQQCSGGIGTSLGYFCTTVPQRICS
jgi:hypothetical protein